MSYRVIQSFETSNVEVIATRTKSNTQPKVLQPKYLCESSSDRSRDPLCYLIWNFICNCECWVIMETKIPEKGNTLPVTDETMQNPEIVQSDENIMIEVSNAQNSDNDAEIFRTSNQSREKWSDISSNEDATFERTYIYWKNNYRNKLTIQYLIYILTVTFVLIFSITWCLISNNKNFNKKSKEGKEDGIVSKSKLHSIRSLEYTIFHITHNIFLYLESSIQNQSWNWQHEIYKTLLF